MGKINFVDGSSAVPGQQEAQKQTSKRSAWDLSRPEDRESSSDALFSAPADASKDTPSLFAAPHEDKDAFGPDYGYRRLRFRKSDEVNPYADQQDERFGFDPRLRAVLILGVVVLVVLVLACLLPTNILSPSAHPGGATLAEFIAEVQSHAVGLVSFFTGQETIFTAYMWEIIAAVLAGAAMGLSGGVYQGALKNALASPSTLGVTSGGSLGLIIYALLFYGQGYNYSEVSYIAGVESMSTGQWLIDTLGMFLSSLAGCVLIVLIIMVIAYIAGRGHVSNVSLVIAGQVLTATIGVVMSVIQYYLIYVAGNETLAQLVEEASSVTFSGTYSAFTVLVFAVPLLVCFVIVFALSGKLSLLAFSDDEARSMGISTSRTRNIMVGTCTVMTALVISFTGPIGFVGFMIPHVARRIIGPEFRYLLPACALLGAALVVVVHGIAYLGIPWFNSGATGTFTSIIGCVFFLVVALKSRGDKRAEWF
ncbi:iron ABC transporter permease [Adlercreutzia equolifaciens]|uniref:FecCD family ABC transporter permease n=1 Tax=Adlercreutzia equolifaciens TaxID=446660 RepID=UPI0023B1D357|nr:iron ABC transporter permease [Adlercreutzia equolifaciens]MDE8701868.1 iron ABC transporter permease [Adlercreutzia equolifaciens]